MPHSARAVVGAVGALAILRLVLLCHFLVHLDRRESQVALERYLMGLLTEHPNKNCDNINDL